MNKKIRFIDSHYKTLFEMEEGGKIIIELYAGGSCTYSVHIIDDYHMELIQEGKHSGSVYHICQFAEFMERNMNICYPLDEVVIW